MAVLFSPWGNQQFFDANGDPAIGWKIYTYAAGSSTPLATYTDATGATPQSQPVVLNALGFPASGQIWLADGASYKLVLTNASDVAQKTEDNIAGVSNAGSAISQWQPSGIAPTYISASSFTLAGDQTTDFHVGRRAQFTTTAGLVHGTISTSAYAALTTITMEMDAGDALDSGLSAVNLSILRADEPALPKSAAARATLGATATGSAVFTAADAATARAALGVDAATSAQIKTGTEAIKPITPAALLAAQGFTAHYSSSNQTITSAGSLTLAHGLGREPILVLTWLKCLTAENGYSVGDKLLVPGLISTSATEDRGHSIVANSTNIIVRFGAIATIVYTALNKTTGAGVGLTNTNWALVVEAFA